MAAFRGACGLIRGISVTGPGEAVPPPECCFIDGIRPKKTTGNMNRAEWTAARETAMAARATATGATATARPTPADAPADAGTPEFPDHGSLVDWGGNKE